ncbi:hypothetical protein D3C75_1126710 [compost metagenome]
MMSKHLNRLSAGGPGGSRIQLHDNRGHTGIGAKINAECVGIAPARAFPVSGDVAVIGICRYKRVDG